MRLEGGGSDVVGGFAFDGWDHSDAAMKPPVVVPVDPGHGGEFDVAKCP